MQPLQCFHWLVLGLLARSRHRTTVWDRWDRVPWRVQTASAASSVPLLRVLLVVRLADVAAKERVCRIESDRDLELLAALDQLAVTDHRESETQPRQRVERIALDRGLEVGARLPGVDLREVDETEHRVGAALGGVGGHASACRRLGFIDPSERHQQLGDSSVDQRAVRLQRLGLACTLQRLFELEGRLLRVGEREPRPHSCSARKRWLPSADSSAAALSFLAMWMMARKAFASPFAGLRASASLMSCKAASPRPRRSSTSARWVRHVWFDGLGRPRHCSAVGTSASALASLSGG